MLNLSPDDYYTQRNNKLKPESACMPTSRAMFYRGNNISFINQSALQDDDYFMFLLNSEEALELRDKKYPHLKGYPPQEIHGMYHSYLDEKVCGKRISDFRTDLTYAKVLELVNSGQVIMTSGNMPGTDGHAFCIIGSTDDILILADPWGDYNTEYRLQGGYGIMMSKFDFDLFVKPGDLKWGHVLL